MAFPSQPNEDVAFPRPLPRPGLFAWALWVAVCVFAYWTYYAAAHGRSSAILSVGFWAFSLVVIPLMVHRSRDRTSAVMAATIALLVYAVLMVSTLR
jgi:hypothetical protein